jgi:potassium channel
VILRRLLLLPLWQRTQHLAASRGYEEIVQSLIHEGVDINLTGTYACCYHDPSVLFLALYILPFDHFLHLRNNLSPDRFGNTPLLEAVKRGHDRVASLLHSKGAQLSLTNAGSHLCTAVAKGDSDFIRRALAYGADPNCRDYDHRTPLHIAAAEGLYLIAKILIDAGASVFATDRWSTTPLDEGRKCGGRTLAVLLEKAMADELAAFPDRGEEVRDKVHPRRCSVFPYHPWQARRKKKEGVVLWIPHTVEGLVASAQEKLGVRGHVSQLRLLSEDGARVLDVDMVNDGQKLYLVGGEDDGDEN